MVLKLSFLMLAIIGLVLGFFLSACGVLTPWGGGLPKASVWGGAVLGLTGLPVGALLCLRNKIHARTGEYYPQGGSIADSTTGYGRALVGVSFYFLLEAVAGDRGGNRLAFFHQNIYLASSFLLLMTVLAFYFACKYASGVMFFRLSRVGRSERR
ncbi:hypothetical protein [Acidovorax sp.]|uniref:hypothetical protein n=1 Tax=Acidovorax sp. TaxID=1872122 RepID=UPI003D042394